MKRKLRSSDESERWNITANLLHRRMMLSCFLKYTSPRSIQSTFIPFIISLTFCLDRLYTGRYTSYAWVQDMDNRSNILSCALQLFSSRGYDAVGVQEIVDAAGVTKPTLYHYFGSKRGMLDVLLKEHFDELYELIKRAAEYQGDLPLTLNKVTAAYFHFAKEHSTFYRMQLSMWFAPQVSEAFVAVSRLGELQQRLLEDLFIRAADDHGNMRGRHRAYAATFLGMINTYIGLSLNGYTTIDDDLVYKAVHQFMHGIFS